MSDEIGTNFEKLSLPVDFLAPHNTQVRCLALKMFIEQDHTVTYETMLVKGLFVKDFVTKDQFDKAYNFVFN